MTLTLDLPPDLQAQLSAEAAKVGMQESDFILNTLKERVCRASVPPRELPPLLSKEETRLLLEINKGLPEETWQEYNNLVAKLRAETLTPEGHTRLIAISNLREEMNAERIGHLAELAKIRNVSLREIMKQLGISSPG